MKRLTNAELNAIRERAEKATPGPWEARAWKSTTDDQYFVSQAFEGGKELATAWQGERYPEMPEIPNGEAEANAKFIAHARSDVPKLLAEIERLRNGIDRVLYHLTNEDISEVYVVEQIADELRKVYNGGERE